jgi:hypothetical protein
MAASILVALLLAALPAGEPGEAPSPFALPRITETLPCVGPDDEIVVCGRRPVIEPWRIPPALREAPLLSRNYSWSARARDEREAGRYGGPPVGPGSFSRSRQVECEWRAERQEIAGLMIDCTQRRVTAE